MESYAPVWGPQNPELKMVEVNIFKGIKTLLFFGLLATVLVSYARDIYTNFHDDATTFVQKTEKPENLFTPPILICMENGLKPTVMKKYGVELVYDFPGYNVGEKQLPVWDAYVEASYILNRDFVITVGGRNLSTGNNTFSEASINPIIGEEGQKGIWVHVSEYHTHFIGTCYQIDSNYSMPPPNFGLFSLQFNESITQADIPPVSTFCTFHIDIKGM